MRFMTGIVFAGVVVIAMNALLLGLAVSTSASDPVMGSYDAEAR